MDNTLQINKFYLSYSKLLENKNEQEFVISLSEIINEITPQNFTKIENIKSCMFDLAKKQLLFAYKMLLLAYVKFCFCEKMIKIFENIDFVFTVEIVADKMKILENYNVFIESFKNVPTILTPINSTGTINSGETVGCDNVVNSKVEQQPLIKNDKYVNIWYIETRSDILNRLNCLRQHFGLIQLNKFKIKNITYDEVCNMSFKKLAKYYNKIVLRIKKEIKKNIQICNIFLEIEEQYIMSMVTSNNSLELNNFSLEIEFDDDIMNDNTETDTDTDTDTETATETETNTNNI